MDANSVAELRASLAKVPYQARWELLKPTIKRLYIDEGRRVADVAEIIKRDYGFGALEDGYKYYINKKWKLRKNIPASKKAAILAVLQTRESTKAGPVVKYKGETVNPEKLRRHLKLARSHASRKAMTRASAHESAISRCTISPLVHEMIMSLWLYQYWQFGYRTAKGWGRTSENWAAGLLRFANDRDSPFSLLLDNTDGTTEQHGDLASFDDFRSEATRNPELLKPSPWCYWTVHKVFDGPEYDVVDEAPQFRQKLREALESSDFSTFKPTSLPVALPQVLKVTEKSPNEFFKEAFGFAIMGRDEDLVTSTCIEVLQQHLDFDGLFPYHLATSYLDGSRTCCNIFSTLVSRLAWWENGEDEYFTNSLGHSVLDNLMITILRSHTSLKPNEIDDTWDQETRFVGQEVDICGRWDADSECVRRLYARGRTTIPFSWKHKFCHTSAQTICHCIGVIAREASLWPGFHTESGLFLKHCSGCGLKLQLYPLHTLVLVAFHLAQHGCEGEDLFGILACLLCILRYGANPLRTAHISLSALRIRDDSSSCDHTELGPNSLAETLESLFSSTWSKEISTGWQIICFVLKSSMKEWTCIQKVFEGDGWNTHITTDGSELNEDAMDMDSDDYVDMDDLEDEAYRYFGECGLRCWRENYFGKSRVLGVLWAAVQTELLTYRRREEDDPWTSDNFNMQDLLLSLKTRDQVGVKLVQDNMMKSYCRCGSFIHGTGYCATVEDACAFYFGDLEDEDCGRMTHIDMPDGEYCCE